MLLPADLVAGLRNRLTNVQLIPGAPKYSTVKTLREERRQDTQFVCVLAGV